MSRMVRFIHITDTHIGPHKDFTLYGRRPYEYLQVLIDQINALPFEVDFVLHTGDVVDDANPISYELFRDQISRLRFPVRYAMGNHDHAGELQTRLMESRTVLERVDYRFDIGGIRFVIVDTRGPFEPGGRVEQGQLDWLKTQCAPDGPPLVIGMHHVPTFLDTPWLDHPPRGWGGKFMFIDNASELLETIRPARSRIRGIFTGHVHGLFITQVHGLMVCAGQSAFGPLQSYPHTDEVTVDHEQDVMFNLVTVTAEQTIIRPRTYSLSGG
ncbi:MAG: hypothetical protein KatS3mg104_2343 [Phycisphaerae bacterium]|jgi:3',5'-cyclic AMP phosphodiesterase CpdA|nr:MAG: hypothetical protein KatS3mg104_2343 [Phycisphaerae bacterium]